MQVDARAGQLTTTAQLSVSAVARRRAIAGWVWIVTIGASIVAAALTIATLSTPQPNSWGFPGANILLGLTFGSVGAVITRRRPGHLVGWLFAGIGLESAVQQLINAYVILAVLTSPGSLPFGRDLAWLLAWVWVPAVATAIIGLPLLFPDGHLPSPRWRPVGWLAITAVVAMSVMVAFIPGPINQASFVDNPLAIAALNEPAIEIPVWMIILGLWAATLAFAIAALVTRARTARGESRLQLKWFLAAATLAFAAGVVSALTQITGSGSIQKAAELLLIACILTIPLAVGLAILRFRLYEIDRLVSRTVSYAVITGVLAAIFVVVVLSLQAILQPITQGQTIAVGASTLVAASLFQPLRRAIQKIVDRRFDRSHYDLAKIVDSFADQLRDEVGLDGVRREVTEALRATVQPAHVGIWLRETRTAPTTDRVA